MGEAKDSRVIRFFPSLTDAAFIMPLVFLFGRMNGAKTLLSDGDTGWHIRTGDWILQNGRVPDKDIFSFTRPGEPWFAWEWLWDAVFAWLHRHWGMAAVVLVSIFVICITFTLLFRLVRRKCGNDVIAIAVTFLATAGSSLHWLARPHLFTLLFVVISYSILERAREGNTRLLWVLPPLTIVWANLHGGFIAGIMLILAYAAGELAAWVVERERERRQAAFARSRPYLLAALACSLASLMNPYGYQLHRHIYGYLTDSFHFKNISEFLSFNFQDPVSMYVELMLLLGGVGAFLSFTRKQFVYALLFLAWARMALYSARNIPIFMIVTAPFAAAALHELLTRLQKAAVASWLPRLAAAFEEFAREFGETDRIRRFHLPSLAAATLLVTMLYAPAPTWKFRAEYDAKKYPAGALEALRGCEPSARIFTHDEWGDYLIYRLYPAGKVFVDGRSDFYGEKFEEKYIDVMNVKHDWENNLRGHGVDTVLLPVGASLAGALKESKRWRPIYDDGVAIVFRPAPENAGGGEMASIVATRDGTDCGWRSTQPATMTHTNTIPTRRRPS